MRRGLPVLFVLFLSRAAVAAPPSESFETVATQKARGLHEEGDRLFEQRKYAEAYAAYIAAWSLKKHYRIAGNLGECEIQLGKHRDAAEHLAIFIREYPPDGSRETVERAKLLYEGARSRIGMIRVSTSHAGAEVWLDGRWIGRAPLEDALYVEPGAHRLEVRAGEGSAARDVTVAAGGEQEVSLRIDEKNEPHAGNAASTKPLPKLGWIIAGSGLTLAGIGAGVGLGVASWSELKRGDELREGLPATACSNGLDPKCDEIAGTRDRRRMFLGLSIASYGIGAAAAIATATYALWPRKKSDATKLGLVPLVAPAFGGFEMGMKF